MQDPRGLPAFKQALNWRAEVTEEHAIRAAQALRVFEVPDGEKADVIAKLAESLERVTGARGVDNRMRIEFLRTLGHFHDNRATPILTKIATAQTEEQNFLINRLAAQQVGQLGDPASVPAMINGLFLFAPTNPAMRMNDVAAEALVRIGRPSYDPLLALLRGENAEAKAIVEQYIEAVRARNAEAAASMNPEMLMNAEATFALGALGYRDALPAILAETQVEDISRRINAAISLVRLNLEPGDAAQVRDALKAVYTDAPIEAKPQLLAAMRHTYDPELMSFFIEQGGNQEVHPQIRLEAVMAYALLANAADVAAMRALIAREPASEDGGYKENFQQNDPLLAAATQCNDQIPCWIQKLGDSNKDMVKKAAYMLGRYGRGNAEAIAALTGKLDHAEIEVRLAALSALDRIAVSGANDAVAKIEELRETEEGRSIWNNFSREALPVQARLRNRAQ
jgi:hypothetical protein